MIILNFIVMTNSLAGNCEDGHEHITPRERLKGTAGTDAPSLVLGFPRLDHK
jgi:hypothetical protein